MAIAKRPTPPAAPAADQERERRERAFLAAAPDLAQAAQPDDARMRTVHLRFEPEMLPRIDAAAKELGLGSRAAWIRYAVAQALKGQDK
jgi:hypothetical protein